MDQQRNLVLAFALSMVILLGWSVLFPNPEKKHGEQQTAAVSQSTGTQKQGTAGPGLNPPAGAPAQQATSAPAQPKAEPSPLLSDKAAFSLSNDVLTLTLNDKGWIIGAALNKYRENLDPGSPHVSVLYLSAHKEQAAYAYSGVRDGTRYVEASPFRLLKQGNAPEQSSLTLQSTLSDGRTWVRTLTLHKDSYVVDVEDRIQGGSATQMFTQVVERSPDKKASRFAQHAGPIALVGDKLHEIKYETLDKDGPQQMESKGGWAGMMTHYFIASIIGGENHDNHFYFKGNGQSYQAGLIYGGKAEKGTTVFETRLFLGPKSMPVLKQLDVGLERSVDFGWFAFIAKPLHSLLVWLHGFIPNYGLCIIVLVLMIKALFFYPTKKSYESMAGMRKLQPEMTRLKELYGDDRQKMGQEMMALYKKHKVNPMGGCLPIVIQIPVFFSLYKVLLMSIEMRQAPFFGWIHDLSAQDPYYVLPVLMGISMFVQQKLNPQPADAMQAKVMQFLPLIFTTMFLFFPSGLVIYWVVNNVLSIIQQYYVMRSQGVLSVSR
ncbi:MAG TPA: membrane protein insertase YidC [Mariprofundaceae bacterium]|nr:membrane protein insertase YidC [Mariprofundaceae bacterium]